VHPSNLEIAHATKALREARQPEPAAHVRGWDFQNVMTGFIDVVALVINLNQAKAQSYEPSVQG